jgi:hypothetical protein
MAATASTLTAGPGFAGPRVWFAVAAPTVDNDTDQGYFKGDIWVDTVLHKVHICEAVTNGAAVWTILN